MKKKRIYVPDRWYDPDKMRLLRKIRSGKKLTNNDLKKIRVDYGLREELRKRKLIGNEVFMFYDNATSYNFSVNTDNNNEVKSSHQ
jgi:hypothetical protein